MFIGEANNKGVLIMVSRDEHGKFFISRNGQRVGVKLNATEMCRWFLNTMHVETIDTTLVPDDELKTTAKNILLSKGIIYAIKYVRDNRHIGLKEAKDYVEALR